MRSQYYQSWLCSFEVESSLPLLVVLNNHCYEYSRKPNSANPWKVFFPPESLILPLFSSYSAVNIGHFETNIYWNVAFSLFTVCKVWMGPEWRCSEMFICVLCLKFAFCRELILRTFLCDGTCKPLLTSKPSLTIALKISKTIEKPSKPMVGPSKNIQWWWSNGIKTIEKPLKSMVAWKKTLTIPSLWKIDHRRGLQPPNMLCGVTIVRRERGRVVGCIQIANDFFTNCSSWRI